LVSAVCLLHLFGNRVFNRENVGQVGVKALCPQGGGVRDRHELDRQTKALPVAPKRSQHERVDIEHAADHRRVERRIGVTQHRTRRPHHQPGEAA
jgi:hypothetical protein